MNTDYLNRYLQVSLSIANYVDRHGENDDMELADAMGLGYRALSLYLRRGVKEVIDLQDRYSEAVCSKKLAEIGEQSKTDFLTEIFGDEEPETLNDELKAKIKEFVKTLLNDTEE